MTRGLLEGPDALAESVCGSFDGGSFFNFGDESGADDGGVGKAAENGHMARKRDAEAHGDGKWRDAASPPEEGGEIVR